MVVTTRALVETPQPVQEARAGGVMSIDQAAEGVSSLAGMRPPSRDSAPEAAAAATTGAVREEGSSATTGLVVVAQDLLHQIIFPMSRCSCWVDSQRDRL